jgi:hypothetical protein
VKKIDQLIHHVYKVYSDTAAIPPFSHDDLEAARSVSGLSMSDFLDCIARRVAHQYFAEILSFEVADCAINSLSAYCLSQHEVMLPSYANEIYNAFDRGEYRHADDGVNEDPETKYTKPQIRAIVVRDRILGAISE